MTSGSPASWDRLQELPSTPQIYAELRAAISDPDTSIERIVKIVEKDVAMCAKVLQMVNSAFFGMMRDITEIRTAVTCLGMNILHNLVLSVEVLRTFRSAQSVPVFSHRSFPVSLSIGGQDCRTVGRTGKRFALGCSLPPFFMMWANWYWRKELRNSSARHWHVPARKNVLCSKWKRK